VSKPELKQTAVFTPKRRPLSFDYENSTNQSQLVAALQHRLKSSGRTSLTKHQDEQFLLGVASVFPLRYAGDLLKLVMESDEVEVSVGEIPNV
jgi:hypothetical protein